MAKRRPLQKLIKVPPRPKPLTALQRIKKELEGLATKNGFLVRRSEYLLTQSYHLNLQRSELDRDAAALKASTVELLERAERLLRKH